MMRQDREVAEFDDGDVFKGLVAGLAGGLVGTAVMTGFQTLWNAASEALASEDDADEHKGDSEASEPATEKAAEAISATVFDHELSDRAKGRAGSAVHYSMGAVSGLVYGAVAEKVPFATAGAGTLFGAAVWLAADEALVPAVGLSKPPTEIPASAQAYALASHLVYGLATDLVRRTVRHLL